MCIVIDINAISCVFNEENSCHNEFKPVNNWILKRNGKIVYGGKSYINELKKLPSYLNLFSRLNSMGKVVKLNDDKVNEEQERIKPMVNKTKFNDPHIIAILAVSKCKVVCSNDKESFEFIHNSALYPKGVKPPKIYSKKSCENLLVDNNIIEICR
jgi:hypothetical protein